MQAANAKPVCLRLWPQSLLYSNASHLSKRAAAPSTVPFVLHVAWHDLFWTQLARLYLSQGAAQFWEFRARGILDLRVLGPRI